VSFIFSNQIKAMVCDMKVSWSSDNMKLS